MSTVWPSVDQPAAESLEVEAKHQHAHTRPPVGRFLRTEIGLDARFDLAPDDRRGEAGHGLRRRPRPDWRLGGDHDARGAHVERFGKGVDDPHTAPFDGARGHRFFARHVEEEVYSMTYNKMVVTAEEFN